MLLCEMKKFKVGDIITRDGTDRHIVEEVWYYGAMLTVRCTKEPEDHWISVGERENNLARRYDYDEVFRG